MQLIVVEKQFERRFGSCVGIGGFLGGGMFVGDPHASAP